MAGFKYRRRGADLKTVAALCREQMNLEWRGRAETAKKKVSTSFISLTQFVAVSVGVDMRCVLHQHTGF